MGVGIEQSVLKKIAEASKPTKSAVPLQVDSVLRLAIAKAAERALKLPVSVTGFDKCIVSLPSLMEQLPEDGILILLRSDDGRQGIFALDFQCLASILEVQTTGQVKEEVAEARKTTAIDAAMCESFINMIFTLLSSTLEGLASGSWLPGFVYVGPFESLRKIGLVLDDLPYRNYTVGLDLALGAKKGNIQIALPAAERIEEVLDMGGADWSVSLQSAVLKSEAQLQAVLHRQDMTVSQVSQLQVGDLVMVPQSSVTSISIQDPAGTTLGIGKLGQSQGNRAIRMQVSWAPNPADE
ncbi:FliM/FliN family flagellar motor switch protein [Cochlodiniinecator piscidefendens]|uniref:FliM/FliN family flagellar motor switch protein n=1 Tax=Cochlodiniinecator piscidefendens TaxID=2715756 RepID=UPI00140E6F7E|nr:FliM/FliN family flagellar motor switch protein [Cochlodiniinecator piscidefendens]